MLKYRKLDYRPWPVAVAFLDCDEATGTVTETEQTFIAHFKPFSEAGLLAARRSAFGDEADPTNKARLEEMPVARYAELEAEFFADLVIGWAKIADESGRDVPYSAAALTALCVGEDGPAFRRGFNRAISQIRFGVAPAKNAETSPSPGPTPASVEVASAN
jgi:hypothetical protein